MKRRAGYYGFREPRSDIHGDLSIDRFDAVLTRRRR